MVEGSEATRDSRRPPVPRWRPSMSPPPLRARARRLCRAAGASGSRRRRRLQRGLQSSCDRRTDRPRRGGCFFFSSSAVLKTLCVTRRYLKSLFPLELLSRCFCSRLCETHTLRNVCFRGVCRGSHVNKASWVANLQDSTWLPWMDKGRYNLPNWSRDSYIIHLNIAL